MWSKKGLLWLLWQWHCLLCLVFLPSKKAKTGCRSLMAYDIVKSSCRSKTEILLQLCQNVRFDSLSGCSVSRGKSASSRDCLLTLPALTPGCFLLSSSFQYWSDSKHRHHCHSKFTLLIFQDNYVHIIQFETTHDPAICSGKSGFPTDPPGCGHRE